MSYLGKLPQKSLFLPRNYIDGLEMVYDGTNHERLGISPGVCMDSTNTQPMRITSTLVKKNTVDWVAGTIQGGFPSALTLATGWYHVFIIKNTATGVVDAGFDTSTTATNLLADATGYTLYRRVGSINVIDEVSGEYYKFFQEGNHIIYDDAIVDVNNVASTTTRTLRTMSIPPDYVFLGRFAIHIITGSSQNEWLVYDPALVDTAPSASAFTVLADDGSHGTICDIFTNTSSQIADRATTTNAHYIATTGYQDFRGTE